MYKNSQSIFEQLFPQLLQSSNTVDPMLASKLFSLWKSNRKVSEQTYARPIDMSYAELKQLESSNLIKEQSGQIKITAKGSNIIKVMILGDESSSYDKNTSEIDYSNAIKKTNSSNSEFKKMATKWWDRD